MLVYLFLGLFACGSDTKGGFSTAGDPLNNSSGSGNDGSNVAPEGNDGEDIVGAEGAPVLSDLTAFYVEQEGAQLRIEIHASYSDAEDDVDEGKAIVEYSSSSISGSTEVNIDGISALHEEGEVTILFQPDVVESFSFTVSLEDTSGNESNSMSASAEPPED